jgi:hypothetical protein
MTTTTAIQNSALPENVSGPSGLLTSGLVARFIMAAGALAFCYCFHWEFLRYWTSQANITVDRLANIHLLRVSPDTVLWRGALYQYENACTFVDVWCASLPLLWSRRSSTLRNLFFISLYSVILFGFNIFRLSVSDLMFAAGLPWNIAHNLISGISYFLVWVWIWTRLQHEGSIFSGARSWK